jgi:hypothetical protein
MRRHRERGADSAGSTAQLQRQVAPGKRTRTASLAPGAAVQAKRDGEAEGPSGAAVVQRDETAPPATPRARAGEAEVGDLGGGFVDAVGSRIEQLAGAVGSELELGVTVRVPIEGRFHLSGQLMLQVAHGDDGYTVKCRPALGLSFGAAGGGEYADLFANYAIAAKAATGRRALEMVSLALEAQCRAMREEPPPALLGLLMSLSPGLLIGDSAGRAINWVRGAGYTSSFWPGVADAIWGAGNMTAVLESMVDGELAETFDEESLGVSMRGDSASASVRVGAGQRRRLERRPGEAQATERTDRVFKLKIAAGFGRFSGEIDASIPLADGDPSGTIKLAVAGDVELSGDWELVINSLVDLIRVAKRAIQEHRQRHGDSQNLQRTARALDAGVRTARGEFYQGGQTALWSAAGAFGLAKTGIEVSAEKNRATDAFTFALTAVNAIEPSARTGNVAVTRKRTLYETTSDA